MIISLLVAVIVVAIIAYAIKMVSPDPQLTNLLLFVLLIGFIIYTLRLFNIF